MPVSCGCGSEGNLLVFFASSCACASQPMSRHGIIADPILTYIKEGVPAEGFQVVCCSLYTVLPQTAWLLCHAWGVHEMCYGVCQAWRFLDRMVPWLLCLRVPLTNTYAYGKCGLCTAAAYIVMHAGGEPSTAPQESGSCCSPNPRVHVCSSMLNNGFLRPI